jgi:hypothetical protein
LFAGILTVGTYFRPRHARGGRDQELGRCAVPSGRLELGV